MKVIIFFAGIFTFISAPCTQVESKSISFDFTSFKQRKLNSADAVRCDLDESVLLGDPSAVRIHPAGFLILRDHQEEFITIIDLMNGKADHLIKQGRGPHELLSAWDIEVYDGDVWVSGPRDNKIIRLTLDPVLRKFEIAQVYNLETPFMRAYSLPDNKFLILSEPVSGRRLEIIDNKGVSLKEAGSFPNVSISSGFPINNALLQSEVVSSPDKRHTAVICKSIDYIDIYDSDMKLRKRIRGPVGVDPLFTERQIPSGTQFIQKPLFIIYERAAACYDGFYVSFNGAEIKSPKDFESATTNQIFSFDWNGVPQICYNLDISVLCFDVDYNNNKIYVITQNPENLELEILIFNT